MLLETLIGATLAVNVIGGGLLVKWWKQGMARKLQS
jgi:hypothetical protein